MFVSIHLESHDDKIDCNMDYTTSILKQQIGNPSIHGAIKDSHEESSPEHLIYETHKTLIEGRERKQALSSSALSNLNREDMLSTQPMRKSSECTDKEISSTCSQSLQKAAALKFKHESQKLGVLLVSVDKQMHPLSTSFKQVYEWIRITCVQNSSGMRSCGVLLTNSCCILEP